MDQRSHISKQKLYPRTIGEQKELNSTQLKSLEMYPKYESAVESNSNLSIQEKIFFSRGKLSK